MGGAFSRGKKAPRGGSKASRPDGDRHKVVFTHGDQQVEIGPLYSEEQAALAWDVLAIKEALDAGADLFSLQLRSRQDERRLDLLQGDAGGRCAEEARSSTFEEVAAQLRRAIGIFKPEDEDADDPDAAAFGLLYWAIYEQCRAVAALVHAAAPAAGGERMLGHAIDMALETTDDCAPIELLLRADPEPAAAVQGLNDDTLISALICSDEAAQLLLAAAPREVLRQYDKWSMNALHEACRQECPEAVQRLLAAAAAAGASGVAALTQQRNVSGWLPLHHAADTGCADAVRMLLEAAPGTAAAEVEDGANALHIAASSCMDRGQGHADVLALLAAAAPEALQHADNEGYLPIHDAAARGRLPALKWLVAAAPRTALAQIPDGLNAVHLAACCGQAEAISVLLAAVPEAASKTTPSGCTPLDAALDFLEDESKLLAVVRAMLPFGSGTAVLRRLLSGIRCLHRPLLPLFADFVSCRLPLTGAEWDLLPSSCPNLGRALPAALAQSPEQAGRLVRHLPSADAARLRLFALCLHRAQYARRIFLPQPLVWHILSLFDA